MRRLMALGRLSLRHGGGRADYVAGAVRPERRPPWPALDRICTGALVGVIWTGFGHAAGGKRHERRLGGVDLISKTVVPGVGLEPT